MSNLLKRRKKSEISDFPGGVDKCYYAHFERVEPIGVDFEAGALDGRSANHLT